MLLVLGACSEYELGSKPVDPAYAEPDIEASPADVAVEGMCDATEQEVVIQNVGEATLTISAVYLVGDGWTLVEVPVPVELEAGEGTVALLTGTGGDATLVVESDDADEPQLSIPLSASTNQGPTVSISAPTPGEVLAEGADARVSGTVGDDHDAPDALQLTWVSSASGVLSAASADATGATAFTWTADVRASGPQDLTLSATDSCGEVGSATVSVCQDGAYTYSALDLSTWHYEGMASWDATTEVLQLTDASTDTVGTAFETSSPVNGDNVEIEFEFSIGGGSGADGISLTALDVDRMSTYLGGTGCGIGYGGDASCTAGPALPGWSIEVDTYYNSEADRGEADHVAFTFDGDVDGYEAYAELPEIEDAGWHTMVVRVLAPRVIVTIDGVTYIDQDIAGTYDFPAYVGFTAGTGSDTNEHLIRGLEVTDYACD